MARLFKRKENQTNFTASTQSRIELSRNYHMQSLLIKLSVNHDNGADAEFNDALLWSLINSIEIVANGNENIKQIPASKLYLDNVTGTGMNGLNSVIQTVTTTANNSYVWARIDFSMPNTIRPHDTILNTALFSTFDLLVNWGSASTLGTDITVNNASLEVFSNSLVNYKRNVGETIKYFKETSLVEEITSSTTEYTISMPVQKLYKGISIVSTVNNARNNDVINSITIKSGTTVFVSWDFQALRAENNMEFTPETTASLDGIAVINFAQRGRLSDMLDTMSQFNTLEVVLDVTKQTGTNRIYILSDTVENTNIVEVK